MVLSANGRIKPDYVLVNGAEERHPEGNYYLEWRDGSKRIRVSVGKNAADALTRKQRKEAELEALAKGVRVVSETEESRRKLLSAALSEYLEEVKLSKRPKTFAAYRVACEYFQASCHKLYLDEIDRKDMLKLVAYLRDEAEQGPRSTYNKFEHVVTFLKWTGKAKFLKKSDWPRYVEEIPEIYEPDVLKKLFAACDQDERVLFEFFLMTGFRDQEVQHACWSDVNLTAGLIRMTHKPDFNWEPKGYKEREVPIPNKLVNTLKKWRSKTKKNCPLIFPTSGGRPNTHFLECLKATAKRAKFEPDDFWLHKFRATFATRCLQGGYDLRTVQAWLGHDDLESTMRYLRPARIDHVRAKMDTIFA